MQTLLNQIGQILKKKKELGKEKIKNTPTKRTEQLRPTRTDYIQKKYLTNTENELKPKLSKDNLYLDFIMYGGKPTNDLKTNVKMMYDEMTISNSPNKDMIMMKYLGSDYVNKLNDKIKKLGENKDIIYPHEIMDDTLKYILNYMLNVVNISYPQFSFYI